MDDGANQCSYRAIVIGSSAGGLNALLVLFLALPEDLPLPIIVVQHIHPTESGFLAHFYNSKTGLPVKEAIDKEKIQPGHIYFSPANYHLLIEHNETFALSIDPKVNYSRPSIDVLFESAAHVWTNKLIAIILTGANQDGARGMSLIREFGGITLAQDPKSAEYPYMPQAAIDQGGVKHILSLDQIGIFIKKLLC